MGMGLGSAGRGAQRLGTESAGDRGCWFGMDGLNMQEKTKVRL